MEFLKYLYINNWPHPIEEWACAENNLGYEQAFGLQEYQMPVANTPDF